MSTRKEISFSALVSFAGSLAVLVPVLWFIGKPLIADAMAEDVKKIVQEEAKPLKGAFTVLIDRDINALRKEIAALKFRQRQGDDWTADDADYLAELEIEIEALRAAKDELKKGEDSG